MVLVRAGPRFVSMEGVRHHCRLPDEFGLGGGVVHMLHAFISSPVIRPGRTRFGVVSLSVVAHAAVITLAAVTSGRTSTLESRLPTASPDQLIFVRAHDFEHRAITIRKGALARAAMKAAALIVPDLTRLTIA